MKCTNAYHSITKKEVCVIQHVRSAIVNLL